MNLRQMVSTRLEPLEKDPIYQQPYRVSMFYRRRTDDQSDHQHIEYDNSPSETDFKSDSIQVPLDHITQTYYQAYERANERIKIIQRGVQDLTDKETYDRAKQEYIAFKNTRQPTDRPSSSKIKVSRYPKALLSQDLLQKVYFINAYQKINQILKVNQRHKHSDKPYRFKSSQNPERYRHKQATETTPIYDYKARLFEVKNKCIKCNSLKCKCISYDSDECIYAAQSKTDNLFKRNEELKSQIKRFARPEITFHKSIAHKKTTNKEKTPQFQKEQRKRNTGILNFSTDFILENMFDRFNSTLNDSQSTKYKSVPQPKKMNSPKEYVFPASETRKSAGTIPKYKKPRIKQSTKLFKQQNTEVDISGVNESGLYISQASFERGVKSRNYKRNSMKARSSSPTLSIKIDIDRLFSPENPSDDSSDT